MKKSLLLLILSGAFLFLISFDAASPEPPAPPPPLDQGEFELQPPIVKHVWIRKLEEPLEDGSNLVMKIEYEPDERLSDEVEIFYSDDNDPIIFHDDGNNPDEESDDNIYTAYLVEDIDVFTTRIQNMEDKLSNAGSYIEFTGHLGEEISEIPDFDMDAFNSHEEVELYFALLHGLVDCSQLLKQNTLFITHLEVVEDQARTYNVATNTGTPMGVWTFGNLIKNIANTTYYSTDIKDFLKSWLEHWTDQKTVNSQTVNARPDIVKYLIGPWLTKCDPSIGTVTTSNWKTLWNSSSIIGDDLLKYAPFKLTAIVNRMDLRGNHAYNSTIGDAGETRFIFTLIDPFNGTVPVQTDQPAVVSPPMWSSAPDRESFVDWEGMNIIFEYRNVQSNRCDLKSFAEGWLHLSSYTDFSPTGLDLLPFLEELEALTHTVIDANSFTSAPNRSAIVSIRTNEKIFDHSGPFNGGTSLNDAHEGWRLADWQLKQFAVDNSTHFLKQVPVTNTPKEDANYVTFDPLQTITAGTNGTNFTTMGSWVQGNTLIVGQGRHNIPSSYLGAVARLDAEFVQYFEIDWGTMSLSNSAKQDIRRQYSVNTCQGCHSGETKTAFTHVRPLPYGEGANYWRDAVQGPPDSKVGNMDVWGFSIGGANTPGDFQVENIWQTITPTGSVDNYPRPTGQRYWQNVSAFLTGRSYSGNTGSGMYDDDESASETNPDNTINGLYYVNDPTNGQYGTSVNDMRRHGYNDLEMRKTHLCSLINSVCDNETSVAIPILAAVAFKPFPPNAH